MPDKYIQDVHYEAINRESGTLIPIVRDIARDAITLTMSGLGFVSGGLIFGVYGIVSGLGFVCKMIFFGVYGIVEAVFGGVRSVGQTRSPNVRRRAGNGCAKVIVNVEVTIMN